MKAKVSRGTGFRGVLNYIFDVGKDATHTKNAERVAGNLAGLNPREMSQEFSIVRELRPDITKPVWHCSLSLPPGECLSVDRWNTVADDFMERMGFDPINTPWVAVRHQDTDKEHIHVVASRVGLDGKVWLGQWEARCAIEATQELERTHGLTLTPGLGDARQERRRLTNKEINRAVRTGEEPSRQQLQRLLDEAIKDNPSVLVLAERLQAAGVGVRANLAGTGRMNGFSFELQGIAFKGSDLGKGYTWSGLQKAGVTYEETRDRAGLERFSAATANRRERQDLARNHEPVTRGLEASAGRDLERDSADLRTIGSTAARRGENLGDLRRHHSRSTRDLGRTYGTGGLERGASVRTEGREAGQEPVRAIVQPVEVEWGHREGGTELRANSSSTGRVGERETEHDPSRGSVGYVGERDPSESLVASSGVHSERVRGRDDVGGWPSHFRQAHPGERSTTNSRMDEHRLEQGKSRRTRVDAKDRQSAREVDPTF